MVLDPDRIVLERAALLEIVVVVVVVLAGNVLVQQLLAQGVILQAVRRHLRFVGFVVHGLGRAQALRRPMLSCGGGSPRRCEIAATAFISVGACESSIFLVSRCTGPAMPTAAVTLPLSSRTGAAMQRMPSSHSSSSVA